jgi:hypothetical protein
LFAPSDGPHTVEPLTKESERSSTATRTPSLSNTRSPASSFSSSTSENLYANPEQLFTVTAGAHAREAEQLFTVTAGAHAREAEQLFTVTAGAHAREAER